jgi:VWFA-related protein
VTDNRGASVGGLGKESFCVFADGRPQAIESFSHEDAPCTVGLMLDASGGLKPWMDREKAAVRAFLGLSNPGDDYFVTSVSSQPAVLAAAGSDPRKVEKELGAVAAGGWTALVHGIHLAAEETRRSRRTGRALVIFSDGIDNHGRMSRSALTHDLMEADVPVSLPAAEREAPHD